MFADVSQVVPTMLALLTGIISGILSLKYSKYDQELKFC